MAEPPPQFSLRAIFGLTGLVAIAMLFVIKPEAAEHAMLGICVAVPGAILGRLTGRDSVDALFGALYGFLAGVAVSVSLPDIH
jgi:hypothetical protein